MPLLVMTTPKMWVARDLSSQSYMAMLGDVTLRLLKLSLKVRRADWPRPWRTRP